MAHPHPHPHSHLVSSLPARAPALFLAAPAGQSSHHPRYATSHSYPESPSLRFMDMELESEAQLLNALPPPIRWHQGQRYTFGTGVGDTCGQISVGQDASTHFQYLQQATPVLPECSFEGDSTYGSDSAQPHRYYQQKPTPAPAAPLLSPEFYGDVEIARSRYFHGHDPYQRHLSPTLYSHHHPETRNCAQIETLYPLQFAHDPYLRVNHNARVLLSFLWPHSVPFGRLHRSLGTSGYLAYGFLLCRSRCRYMARFLVVEWVMARRDKDCVRMRFCNLLA